MPKTLFGRVLFHLIYGTGFTMAMWTGLTMLGDFLEKRETDVKEEERNEDNCKDTI